MNVSVILAHPNEESFNHAIAKVVIERLTKNNIDIFFHDLYKERFNPVLTMDEIPKEAVLDSTIEQYCSEIMNSDAIIVIHPNWWGQPPAILKGWIDRVIRPGVAYEFQEDDNGEGVPKGLLKAKHAIVFNTSNTPEHREMNVFGDPLESLWRDCIFSFCGVEKFHRKMFGVVVTSTLKQRAEWLREVKRIVDELF